MHDSVEITDSVLELRLIVGVVRSQVVNITAISKVLDFVLLGPPISSSIHLTDQNQERNIAARVGRVFSRTVNSWQWEHGKAGVGSFRSDTATPAGSARVHQASSASRWSLASDEVTVAIYPYSVILVSEQAAGLAIRSSFHRIVEAIAEADSRCDVTLNCGGIRLKSILSIGEVRGRGIKTGDKLWALVNPASCAVVHD